MAKDLREGIQGRRTKLEMMDERIYQLDYGDGCMGV